MINLLIKIADSLDARGLHVEASQVDELIRKIARDLEEDFSKNAAKKKKTKKKEEDIDVTGDGKYTMKDKLVNLGVIDKDGNKIDKKKKSKKKSKKDEQADKAYDDMVSKRSRTKKKSWGS